jgi:predicted glycosyltransferase involved in capsule biosynthesis
MKDVCIVVPYRNREEHLKQFAPHMHEFLEKEGLTHDILIVEQTDKKPFNRAKLLNVGFDYAKGKYKNYVFHDVDMLPIANKASYAPVSTPTHYAAIVEQFGWSLAYQNYVGGVTSFDEESFTKINGFCNEYWGWGAEDDDLFQRCVANGVQIMRRHNMYASLNHDRVIEKPLYDKNLKVLQEWKQHITDGLSTLSYDILKEDRNDLYIQITVEI